MNPIKAIFRTNGNIWTRFVVNDSDVMAPFEDRIARIEKEQSQHLISNNSDNDVDIVIYRCYDWNNNVLCDIFSSDALTIYYQLTEL